nr:ATP-binding protein [uncultured Sediminibacterium sp.]
MIHKIVILGPESTGKSTLCELLAQHYNTLWCPEFAREYLTTHGMDYDFDDLLSIAKGQLALEKEYENMVNRQWSMAEGSNPGEAKRWVNVKTLRSQNHPPLLFVDTDMYVMKVWCEYVFQKCHHFILNEIIQQTTNFYLLCKPDLPWAEDVLREYPDEKPRLELYQIYRDIMINQKVPWVEIFGDYDARLEKAISAIDKFIGAQ